MMKVELTKAINKQINEELYSAYLYVAMVNYFESVNLKGFAGWMKSQVVEELNHANKMMNYLYERGAEVTLDAIAAPTSSWKTPLAAFESAYKHECHITACLNDLYAKANKVGDHAAAIFLTWFVNEQVEEEGTADGIVQQIKLADGAPGALFMLDRELATRMPNFTPAAPAK